MDRLTTMTVFRAVAEAGSFAGAARRLRLSNGAVSKHISALEDALGARLIHRTTRRLALTEVGQSYYKRCARILDEIEAMERDAGSENAAPRGLLRVGAPMSFGLLHLAPALPDLLAAHPELEVGLELDDRFVDLVDERIDVALRIMTSLPDSSYAAAKIAPIRSALCAAPAYLARAGTPRSPEELAGHVFVVYSLSRSPGHYVIEGPDGPHEIRVTGRITANSSIALREALAAGVGIGVVPTFVVGEALRDGTLVRVLDEYEPRGHTLHAVYPAAQKVPAKVRAFMDFLRQRFGGEPPWDRDVFPPRKERARRS